MQNYRYIFVNSNTKCNKNSIAIKIPPVTKLSYEIDTSILSAIENCNVSVRMYEIDGMQLGCTYSKILSAGGKFPLSANTNVVAFVDITLPDVVQLVSGVNCMIALTKQGIAYGRGENAIGELAIGDTTKQEEWTKINVCSNAVTHVAYSCGHVLFLAGDGQVFSCGSNATGQLVKRLA